MDKISSWSGAVKAGIVLNEVLPFSIHSETKWCAQALGYESAQMNPGYLFTLSKSMIE